MVTTPSLVELPSSSGILLLDAGTPNSLRKLLAGPVEQQ